VWLILLVEDVYLVLCEVMVVLVFYIGNVYVIGIIGSFGVGKLILILVLVKVLCYRDFCVGVLVVDFLLLFLGGALFGDRVCM